MRRGPCGQPGQPQAWEQAEAMLQSRAPTGACGEGQGEHAEGSLLAQLPEMSFSLSSGEDWPDAESQCPPVVQDVSKDLPKCRQN